MDNASPLPPKRPRTNDFLTSQLNKPTSKNTCNRKMPGILQRKKIASTDKGQTMARKLTIRNSPSELPISSSMKFVPNKEINISSKLQKLKLKSSDGRDLGEINVKLFPQKGNGIGGKTIMLKKHSMFGKLDSSTAVSILKPLEKNKLVPNNGPIITQTSLSMNAMSQTSTKQVPLSMMRPLRRMEDAVPSKPVFILKQNMDIAQTPLILRNADIPQCLTVPTSSKMLLFHVDKQTGVNSMQNIGKDVRNLAQLPSKKRIVMYRAENYSHMGEDMNNDSQSTLSDSRTFVLGKKEDSSTELSSSMSISRNITRTSTHPLRPTQFTHSSVHTQKSKKTVNANGAADSTDTKRMMMVTQSGKCKTPVPTSIHQNTNMQSKSITTIITYGEKLGNSRRGSCEDGDIELPTKSTEVTRIFYTKDRPANRSESDSIQNISSTTNNITPQDSSKQDHESLVTTKKYPNLYKIKSQPINIDQPKSKSRELVKHTEGKSSNDKNLRENIMVILHGDMNTLNNNEQANLEQQDLSSEPTSTDVDIRSTSITETTCNENRLGPELLKHGVKLPDAGESIKQNAISSSRDPVSPKQQDFNIIQKALTELSTLTDQDLRQKALKALADCGIGVNRDVPVPPKVSVRDSLSQTKVFGLLDPQTFVECNNSSPVLESVNLVNKDSDFIQLLAKPVSFDFPGRSSANLDFCENSQASSIDCTKVIEQLLSETSKTEVDQISDMLVRPDPLVSKVFAQIQRDFEAATTIDDKGMMGIHRAVLSDDIKEVQRHLIILRARKEDIDVLTEDGKTSLELAVLHEIDSRITKVLLAAGARPAFPMKLHESAIIIGCKMQAAILPELISHTLSPTLLDGLDSEGFTPLHYCAQLGNIYAVKLLVAAGANVNLRDAKSGRTPLFHALENRHTDIAWHLLEHGASPHTTNFAGQSPAPLIDEYKHHSLAEKFSLATR